MTTPTPKPVKKALNPKLLTLAAILLVVLALLFMVTPLLRTTARLQRTGNFVTQNGGTPAGSNGAQNRFPGQGGGVAGRLFGQGSSSSSTRRLTIGAGPVGPILYFVALLASLAAALGMLFIKRWGQVFGIVMAAFYLLLGLFTLIPLILVSALGFGSPLSLVLSILHVLLAVAVIVLASIPARAVPAPASA